MRAFWIFILVLVSAASATAQDAKLPTGLDLEALRGMPVQHDGRWPPLDTLARDTVWSVTGRSSFQGTDPILHLLAWTFDSVTWKDQPLIKIGNAELRRELQLSPTKTVYSYNDLTTHPPLRAEMGKLASIGERKMNPLEKKVNSLQGTLLLLDEVFQGQRIRVVPDPNEIGGNWLPMATRGLQAPESMTSSWDALRAAFLAGDAAGFTKASSDLVAAQKTLPAAFRPDPRRLGIEIRYNKTQPFRTAWMLLAAGALLSAAALFIRQKWFDVVAVLGLIAGFAFLNLGLWERWQIAGRIPASNMYESLLFLSWGTVAFAIVSLIAIRDRLVPFTASFMGALSLCLSDVLPLDAFIRPVAPVLLDTIWMSIHVPIIMVAYGVLAIAVFIAHIQIIAMAFAPRAKVIEEIDQRHYWYVHVGSILLLIGIVTGSIWAASSWGRYWGWDPKEVWSLVAMLGYLTILHVRIDSERIPMWTYAIPLLLGVGVFAVVIPKLEPITQMKSLALAGAAVAMILFVLVRGQFATAMKSIVGFWLIIMTYVGVNFVLGIGLHTYGFGTGAVVKYMKLLAMGDMIFIGIMALIYLLQRMITPAKSQVAAA